MGLLDKLWDDTLAGPRPDTGLGRLRRFSTFTIRTDLTKESEGMNATAKSGPDSPMSPAAATIDEEEAPRVTRSIMIRRPAGSTPTGSSPPVSPAGSTPPVSPFFGPGSVGREWRFRRRSMSDAYERRSSATAPPTPTGATATAAGTGSVGSRRPNANPFDV